MGIRNAPFARARMIFAAIAAAVSANLGNFAGTQSALQGIDRYESRGKGRAGYQASRRCVAHDKRAACKARNRSRNRRAHA